MKLTKQALKRIIREETKRTLKEGPVGDDEWRKWARDERDEYLSRHPDGGRALAGYRGGSSSRSERAKRIPRRHNPEFKDAMDAYIEEGGNQSEEEKQIIKDSKFLHDLNDILDRDTKQKIIDALGAVEHQYGA
jgi:hypothetical protein